MSKIFLVVRDFFRQMRKKNLSAFSASTAFFLFLSLGPMLAFACTLIPYLPLTSEDLFETVMMVLPDKVEGVAKALLAEIFEKSTSVMSLAALTMIWAAGKGTLAMMRGLNAIHGVEEERNYFVVRMVASIYTLAIVLAIFSSLGLIVFSNFIIDMVCIYLPQTEVALQVIAPFRYMIVWIFVTGILASIYCFLPSVKLRFKKQIPGAMVAAGFWSVFSWGFSLYMDYFDMTAVYGSLSVLVLALLWLYFGMYIILLGAYLNRYFANYFKKESLMNKA
ncbi:MAG: YihY/virulence factor BrkB family protein [Lachnospiraceae bacterium]|nr:YihY/virulence factor BrkB family protein [Lachnospiraceae bacterium]